MVLDQHQRRFVVGEEAAYIEPGVTLGGVRLELSKWSGLSLLAEVEGQGHVSVDQLPAELSDICEFEMEGGSIRMSGFLRQARGWCELIFHNPKMAVEYATWQNTQSHEHTP
ncbi:hypothetical protein GCM10010844_36050 [Deinococcus radiotolerans]|uniref:PilZ domain-containing protein n=2 Tax=Deinococcus radiotolerans TaxID=1309407 RepID=A0ABQ2FPI6_9DEIO|nr:hypothetical protein GCM10010844_36050 [Deinococcus radiotolerans]